MYYNFDYSSAIDSLDNNDLNFIHINIRSLYKNFDCLKTFLSCVPKTPDVMAITETWQQEHTKLLCSMEGYDSFHLVGTNREHGGITIFDKCELKTDSLMQFSLVNDNIEIFSTKIE